MTSVKAASAQPLSTVPFLLALMMRPLPLLPLQAALFLVLRRICDRHPHIFDRLGGHARKRFGIVPTDLPFAFVLEPLPPHPRLSVTRRLPAGLDARISSSLAGLFGLVEGSLDGDALMFSRDLLVEGDVEAVLALRNAIDDAQLDLMSEIADAFGPLSVPLKHVLRVARSSAAPPGPRHPGAGSWS